MARFGGHSEACGFTLSSADHLAIFKESFLSYANEKLAGYEFSAYTLIEADVNLSDIDLALLEVLNKFEPFGQGNSKPLFLLKNLAVVSADFLGEKKEHLRLRVKQSDYPRVFKAMSFWTADDWKESLLPGATFDAIAELGINEWNGSREMEIKIIDIHL